MAKGDTAEKAIKGIRRKTRRRFSAEEKIRIVMEGMRGEESISTLCRREGIAANLYYRWSKDFLEAGKKRLAGDTKREATSTEVVELRKELAQLKELVAEVLLENRVLKKTAVEFDSDGEDTCGSPRLKRWRPSAWWSSRICRGAVRSSNWVSICLLYTSPSPRD